jgi:uncharacterized protein (TIGR03083 family)
MSSRPLRQYYDPVEISIPADALRVELWLRHRQRFLDELATLTDEQWQATTRCSAWDATDVLGHLVAVDAFWVLVLSGARNRQEPTTYVKGFDPSTGTDPMVAATRSLSNAEMLERFTTGTEALIDVVTSFVADDWDALGESPLGHVPARFLFGHAYWDSWMHERDIFVPLGAAPNSDADELLALLCFTFVFAGLQGGLLNDPAPVGPGLIEPIDVTLVFDELPDRAVRVQIDNGVRVRVVDPDHAIACGSAYDAIEGLTGRRSLERAQASLPPALGEQFGRATLVL